MTKTFREITIESMIDQICCVYGFETKVTINFCRLCEKSDNYLLIKKRYNKLIKK